MNDLDDLAEEIEDDLTEEVSIRLVCRACGDYWEYIAYEAVGFKTVELIECPHCSARTVLSV